MVYLFNDWNIFQLKYFQVLVQQTETARLMRCVTMVSVLTPAPAPEHVVSTPTAVSPDTGSSACVPRTSLVTPRWSVSGSPAPVTPPLTVLLSCSAVMVSACQHAPQMKAVLSMRDVSRVSACVSIKYFLTSSI